METKKTKKADLESSKASSYLMGLVVGLAIIFVGFEWGTQDVKAAGETGIVEIQDEEDIEITRPDEPPPPPPEPPKQVVEIINIVEDDVKLEQEEIVSSEDNSKLAQAQTYVPPAAPVEEEEASHEIFSVVETMPSFPGGDSEMMKFLYANIKYPPIAQENGLQGRVIVQFVVNKDGSIVDATVMRGVDASLDKEALRVINIMPKWSPGKQRGKPVRVKYTVPVVFKLQ